MKKPDPSKQPKPPGKDDDGSNSKGKVAPIDDIDEKKHSSAANKKNSMDMTKNTAYDSNSKKDGNSKNYQINEPDEEDGSGKNN